jgi:hypothetical protein
MMHPDTELRFVSKEVGLGVFATKFIPKGTIVWILDDLDMILEEEYVDNLDEIRSEFVYKYSYQENDGRCKNRFKTFNNRVSVFREARFLNQRFILPDRNPFLKTHGSKFLSDH